MHRRSLLLALSLLLASHAAWAQTYPNRPVRLLVPFAPGGTTDIIARIVAEKMSATLGQTVVVENKSGAGGSIGAAELAKSPADGYVLGMSTVSTVAANPAINPQLTYDPIKDFIHIINLAATPNVIAVHPSFPAKDYKGFLNTLQSNPGKYSYGTAGAGSIGHLQTELYKSMSKAFITHIPYRGSAPALNDAVAGQIPIVFDNLPSALPFIKDKRLVPIVVAAPTRLAGLPDVPTFAEVGLEPVNRMAFYGISAPKDTPKEVIDKVNAAAKSALADASVKRRIEATGSFVIGNSPEEFQKQVRDELFTYKRVVFLQKLKLE